MSQSDNSAPATPAPGDDSVASSPGAPMKIMFPGGVSVPAAMFGTGSSFPPILQGFETQLQTWIMTGGLNHMMGENCVIKGCMSAAVGGGGGLLLGAFLAPFDTMSGLKVWAFVLANLPCFVTACVSHAILGL